jgi:hypothetical protein
VAKIAALFTRMSIRPQRSAAARAIASVLSTSATSVRVASAWPPAASIWRAVSAAASPSRSATSTRAPSLASPSA